MAGPTAVAAVDLGASGGRVMVGLIGRGELDLREAHRFPNIPVAVAGTLHWDVLRLYAETLEGLRAAGRECDLAGIGIDSWAVDYGLLDASGALLGNPVHYRDARTDGVAERVHAVVGARQLYERTGIAHLPFNTAYQLAAAAGGPQLAAAKTLLLIPDLFAYWLTGEVGAEATNASTTSLYDVRERRWATSLMTRLGLAPELFPPLRAAGEVIGALSADVGAAAGLAGPGTAAPGRRAVPVIAVGSHDTASAVAAVPATGTDFAYISCGTWSLVGMELDAPVLTEASRLARFTNEAGIGGTIRYLRNVMGLWPLQESMRGWREAGMADDLAAVLAQAAAQPPLRCVVDLDDPVFLPPSDMTSRIAAACRAGGQPAPDGPAQTVRCVLDSLALAHRRAVRQVQELSGRHADAVHLVGGGSRNALLCQLTADACGLPVVAGPAEAAALGNALVQGQALGAVPPGLAGLRALIRDTQPLRRFAPARAAARAWESAAARLG